MKEKASIEANLHVLKQEKEATAASKEAAIYEAAAAELEQRESEALGELQELALEDPMKRTKDYIETQPFNTQAPQALQGARPPQSMVHHGAVNTQPSSNKAQDSLYESFMEENEMKMK